MRRSVRFIKYGVLRDAYSVSVVLISAVVSARVLILFARCRRLVVLARGRVIVFFAGNRQGILFDGTGFAAGASAAIVAITGSR